MTMRIFYPSEYFEEEDEEKEVYGWIFRSDDGFMDTDDTDEDEQRRGEKREIWNCVVSEIGAKKITFDSSSSSSSSSSSHHLSDDDDDDDDDDAVLRILFPRRNHKKETTKNENGKRNVIKVIEAKRIGKIIFRNDDIDIDEHKEYTIRATRTTTTTQTTPKFIS